MDLSFTIAAGPRQCNHSRVLVPGAHNHILLSHIRDFPNLEGEVPVFISSRNRVAQLYLQTLGSLFVASYKSQDYGGGIRNRLHTLIVINEKFVSVNMNNIPERRYKIC
jgi:hypothetical protein